MGRYILKSGSHRQGTKTYRKVGSVVESDKRLDKLFPNNFRRAFSDEDEELTDQDARAIEKVRKLAKEAKKKRNLDKDEKKKKSKDKKAKKAKAKRKKSREDDDE